MGRRTPSPEAIAAGAGRPGVAELVALVHRVNPTGRALPPAEEAARYALKARLQSRLVREWSAHLDFVLVDPAAGVVALNHRGYGRDAAHVPLAELDPDARAIVEQALAADDVPRSGASSGERTMPLARPAASTAAPAPSGRRAPAASEARDDALSRGRAARDAWDLDAARRWFEAAWTAGRDEASAHALLELLVDDLAHDEAALRLEVPASIRSTRVTRLLALATARAGDPRAAATLARGLDRAGEAEIRLLLADRALSARDLDATRQHLDALRRLDPANAAVVRLTDALAERAAAGAEPLERALADAVAAGGPARVRAAAAALLAVSPGSPAARSALEVLDAAEVAADVAARLAAAAAHERAGRPELALLELERARELGADVRAELHRVRDAVAGARLRRGTEEAAAAAARGDLRPYLELPAAARAEIRARGADDRLALLEELLEAEVADPSGALVVVERARRLHLAGRSGEAVRAIEAARLGRVGAVATLLAAARSAERAEAVARTRDRAARVVRAVEAGDDEAAAVDAEGIVLEHLGDGAAAFTEVLARLRARRADAELERRCVALLDQDLFATRLLIEERVTASADEPWTSWLAKIDVALAQRYPSRRVEPWGDDLRHVRHGPLERIASASLEADGRHAWLAEGASAVLFLRRFEVATSRVAGCWVVFPTSPFVLPRTTVVDGRVQVANNDGDLFVVEPGPSEVGSRLERVVLHARCGGSGVRVDPVPSRDVVAVVTETDSSELYLTTVRRGVVEHTKLVGAVRATPFQEAGEGRVLTLDLRTAQASILDLATRRVARLGMASHVGTVAPRPGGDGIVAAGVLGRARVEDHALHVLASRGAPPRPYHVPKQAWWSPLATSHDQGLVFLLEEGGGLRSSVVHALDADLRLVWKAPVHGAVHLLTDVASRHVVLVLETLRGPRLVPLGPTPPELPPDMVMPVFGGGHVPAATPTGTAIVARAAEVTGHDDLRALLDAVDPLPPEEAFRRLDTHRLWSAYEIQSLARLAEAALGWEGGPWAQRLHALAVFHDGYLRFRASKQLDELQGARSQRSPEALDALASRAEDWLLAARRELARGAARAGAARSSR